LTGQDKKEIRQIFNEGIEQLILPHFESIDEGFEAIDKRFEENQREHGDLANSMILSFPPSNSLSNNII